MEIDIQTEGDGQTQVHEQRQGQGYTQEQVHPKGKDIETRHRQGQIHGQG